ncbi:hypothetical protein E2562_017337 [Oryza meyeriana var. granulata]|uniref:Uncharacterized protein n=1 Tax=Oryza meyeriana var. granulata TaxID=110450 RepID=A0A6G1BWW0_9ORYZ|nr:hypothetical protein E2562_017337 [Oryza meyeriana var. granulata]
MCIRYALPGEGLGLLRDMVSDGDLWILVSLLFFHEVVTNFKPNQSRIRVFLFDADALVVSTSALALTLWRSASSPFLLTLVEEDEDDDTMATTPVVGGGSRPSRVTEGMRQSVSLGDNAEAEAVSTSDGATSASGDNAALATEGDTPATSSAAMVVVQFVPMVLVPVMPAMVVYPVIPVNLSFTYKYVSNARGKLRTGLTYRDFAATIDYF